MCLANAEQIVLEKDLVVYKALLEKNGELMSPFFKEFKWEIGKLFETKKNYPKWSFMCNNLHIFGDAFHTFADLPTAQKYMKDFIPSYNRQIVFCECVIPKNSNYVYVSKDGLEYASEKLKINKILDV